MDSFKTLEEVGRGMYGTVYKAYDTQLRQMVAVKKIKHDSEVEGILIHLQHSPSPHFMLHDKTFHVSNWVLHVHSQTF